MTDSPTPPGSPGSAGQARPAASALLLTGERTLPGIPDERYWFQRHVVAYRAAAQRVRSLSATSANGLTVLDAGCGEGYGLAMLADAGATEVVGVDLDLNVTVHAQATYARRDPLVETITAELSSLPLADDVVDLLVSFQVIEHLYDIPGYLHSLRRVTRAGGEVWIATPNRSTFTPGREVPVNPFHVREFTAAELRDELVSAGFDVPRLLGVHHGERLRALERRRATTIMEAMAATSPEWWDDALRVAVHATTPDDFDLHGDDLDSSLDLLAIARVTR